MKGSGWFRESHRHALAARGVKTGRKQGGAYRRDDRYHPEYKKTSSGKELLSSKAEKIKTPRKLDLSQASVEEIANMWKHALESPEQYTKEAYNELKKKYEEEKEKTKEKITGLLYPEKGEEYYEKEERKDPEIIQFTIPGKKAKDFEFLQDHTLWPVRGRWFDKKGKRWDEGNRMFEIMFKDTKSEKVGKALIDVFKKYGGNFCLHKTKEGKWKGEEMMYVKTLAVEEQSIFSPEEGKKKK